MLILFSFIEKCLIHKTYDSHSIYNITIAFSMSRGMLKLNMHSTYLNFFFYSIRFYILSGNIETTILKYYGWTYAKMYDSNNTSNRNALLVTITNLNKWSMNELLIKWSRYYDQYILYFVINAHNSNFYEHNGILVVSKFIFAFWDKRKTIYVP